MCKKNKPMRSDYRSFDPAPAKVVLTGVSFVS